MDSNGKALAIEQIAAAIAHEVKNPLTMVKANIDLLEASDGTVTHQKNYTMIRKELDKINDIMMDFIYLTRPNNYEGDIVYLYDTLGSVTESVLTAWEGQINIQINCRNKEIATTGSEKALFMLFNNIIKNAIEAMDGYGSITINISKKNQKATIEIADTGKGIPADLEEEVFQEFFTTKSTGSGLGLSICKKIVHEHNGSFELKNGSDSGCIAAVVLPSLAD